MAFTVAAVTDVGTTKQTNQDSACVVTAHSGGKDIAMALVCDGMGGLAKGELASATVLKAFESWFYNELPPCLPDIDWQAIAMQWEQLVKSCNLRILQYGEQSGISLGTTCSALLVVGGAYLVLHVGDSRIYLLDGGIRQLTDDHSVVGREIRRGTMTLEQAEQDARRNVLLQCVGASRAVVPQTVRGTLNGSGCFLLCSDGLRHKVSDAELLQALRGKREKAECQAALHGLVDAAKQRGERDNITAAAVLV